MNDMTSRAAVRLSARSSLLALAVAAGLGAPALAQTAPATAPATPADSMARDWPPPEAGIDKHRGYAFQWYALAALALLFYVMTGFRRGSRTNH